MIGEQDKMPGAELKPAENEATWSEADRADLAKAVAALERTSFATRMSGLVGRQIGFIGDMIPDQVSSAANAAASKALNYALRAAVATLPAQQRGSFGHFHTVAVAASGALGGAFGLAALPLELPVSTALILRSVAAIARQEGEDFTDPAVKLACLEVFALGAGPDRDHLGNSGYLAARALMARSVTEAARHLARRGALEETAPAVLRLMAQIASRFGLVVSQKIVAQAVPVVGAVAGAAVNAAFMEHYQTLARGHFIVRRLERKYGADAVRAAYGRLRQDGAQDHAGPHHGSDPKVALRPASGRLELPAL